MKEKDTMTEQKKNDTLILVIYVGVGNIRSADVNEFIKKISARIVPNTINAEIIIIPTESTDTRIECINPKYITENELIKQNSLLMYELNYELQKQIEYLKNEKN